jgi:hypothetical protein
MLIKERTIMTEIEKVVRMIEDPFNGPFEGEDFSLNENGFIEVPVDNVKLAGTICSRINKSSRFTRPIVKFGTKGDCILLGFDYLSDVEPIFTKQIGYRLGTLAEIKQDSKDQYHIYIDGKKQTKTFEKLAVAKAFITKLDKIIQASYEVPKGYDDVVED